jgi:hypothetical protein
MEKKEGKMLAKDTTIKPYHVSMNGADVSDLIGLNAGLDQKHRQQSMLA